MNQALSSRYGVDFRNSAPYTHQFQPLILCDFNEFATPAKLYFILIDFIMLT